MKQINNTNTDYQHEYEYKLKFTQVLTEVKQLTPLYQKDKTTYLLVQPENSIDLYIQLINMGFATQYIGYELINRTMVYKNGKYSIYIVIFVQGEKAQFAMRDMINCVNVNRQNDIFIYPDEMFNVIYNISTIPINAEYSIIQHDIFAALEMYMK